MYAHKSFENGKECLLIYYIALLVGVPLSTPRHVALCLYDKLYAILSSVPRPPTPSLDLQLPPPRELYAPSALICMPLPKTREINELASAGMAA